jgi:hypothetical protein
MKQFLRRLVGERDPGAAHVAPVRDLRVAAEPIDLRVCMIVYDPLVEAQGGRRLREVLGWHDPEQLARQYLQDLHDVSGGIARYTVAEQHVLDEYPRKIDGFRYDDASYLTCWRRRAGFHQPDAFDYRQMLERFAIEQKVANGTIDEVWLFAFPYAGFYESCMAGPEPFWCNAPPLSGTERAARRFVIMGFNYERDVGCMLENFGHRVESIMRHVYRNHSGENNLWERFIRHEQTAPGAAACGNVHFAPNSRQDYDWGHTRVVASTADNWYRFPDLQGPTRPMDCREWGAGDMRLHHRWWLDHLPRVAGSSAGVLHNWWTYVLQPDQA